MNSTSVSSLSPTTPINSQNFHQGFNSEKIPDELRKNPQTNVDNANGNTRLNQVVLQRTTRSLGTRSENGLSSRAFSAFDLNNLVLFKGALEEAKISRIDISNERNQNGDTIFDVMTKRPFDKVTQEALKSFFEYLSAINAENSDRSDKDINNVRNREGKTTFDILVNKNFNESNKRFFETILKLGFDINTKDRHGKPVFFQLFSQEKISWRECVIETIDSESIESDRRQINFNLTDRDGNTLMHLVAKNEDINLLKYFLEKEFYYKEFQTGRHRSFFEKNNNGETVADIISNGRSEDFKNLYVWMASKVNELYSSDIIVGTKGAENLRRRPVPDSSNYRSILREIHPEAYNPKTWRLFEGDLTEDQFIVRLFRRNFSLETVREYLIRDERKTPEQADAILFRNIEFPGDFREYLINKRGKTLEQANTILAANCSPEKLRNYLADDLRKSEEEIEIFLSRYYTPEKLRAHLIDDERKSPRQADAILAKRYSPEKFRAYLLRRGEAPERADAIIRQFAISRSRTVSLAR